MYLYLFYISIKKKNLILGILAVNIIKANHEIMSRTIYNHDKNSETAFQILTEGPKY